MKNRKVYQVIFHITIILFLVSGLGLGLFYMLNGKKSQMYVSLGVILLSLIPLLFKKLNVKIPARLYILLYAFLILAYNIGFIMDGYNRFSYYDKLVHFISGFINITIGGCIFTHIDKGRERHWGLMLLFVLSFSMLIALTCEYIEFLVFLFTGRDVQHTLTTGVFDTMIDLVTCLVGSMISVLFYVMYAAKGIKIFRVPIIEEYRKMNFSETNISETALYGIQGTGSPTRNSKLIE